MSSHFYLFIVLIVFKWCNGLKIFENSLNTSEFKKFYHRTADFGPKPGDYNVSGVLRVFHPFTACSIDQHINRTRTYEDMIVYNQIYKDAIVLILRGNCTFTSKATNAQLLGAVGVVVGDYNASNDEWIVMSKDPTKHSTPITIPAVFVPHNTYQWIVKLLLSQSNEPLSNVAVYAILDENGEYIAQTSAFWLAAFGIVIIVIPTLWCFIVCMALLRKRIIRYIQRSRRRQYLTQIPVILYKGNGAEKSGLSETDTVIETESEKGQNNFKNMSRLLLNPFRGKKESNPISPHNDSCAICLEDFEMNEELRLLPCNHGFHKGCVDPWLDQSSELCPLCKQSIFASDEVDKSGSRSTNVCCNCCARNGGNILSDESELLDADGMIVSSNEHELVAIDSGSDHQLSHGTEEENLEEI